MSTLAVTPETRSAYFTELHAKIQNKTARVGVVGLGYVGLPLAVEYAKEGYEVVGIDLSKSKVDALNKGESYIQDVPTEEVARLVKAGKLSATTSFEAVKDLDTINICVPTPLRKTKDPDMSFIVSSCGEIARYFHAGLLVILESTTYPGTTDELVLPILAKSGLQVGSDFFLCFSPERVDPGNPKYQTVNIPKVVGGCTPACTEIGRLFYAQALDHVVPVSSTQVAEMVKLLENTFRMINIGLVNEIVPAAELLPTALAGQLIVFETLAALAYAYILRGQMPQPLTLIGIACLIEKMEKKKSRDAGLKAKGDDVAGIPSKTSF